MCVSLRCLGSGSAVYPAPTKYTVCRGDPSAGVSKKRQPQHTWELFLMASTPFRSILEWVSFKQHLLLPKTQHFGQ